jgi:uncharacterized protein
MTYAAHKSVRFLQGLLLAVVLVTAPAAAQAPSKDLANGSPAIWKIQGPKGKVYLFGSFHMLPENVQWRSPAVDQAMTEAEVFVYEVDLLNSADPQQAQPIFARYGMLPQGQTLKDVLPASVYAELGRICMDLGIPRQQFAGFRPWFAAMMVSVQSIVNMGFNPSSGVEFQSLAWAKANNKKFGSLETLESQLRIFADLDREQEVQFVQATLEQVREAPKILRTLLLAYRTGDVVTIDKLMNEGMSKFPRLRDRVLKDRNAQWVPQIDKMLQDGRTHIVIVGVGHLVGPDSVVAMLRAKNVAVEGPGAKAAVRP